MSAYSWVVKGGIFNKFPHPLCKAERVDQRSVVGVSQLTWVGFVGISKNFFYPPQLFVRRSLLAEEH